MMETKGLREELKRTYPFERFFETGWNFWLWDIRSVPPNMLQRPQIIFASGSVACLSLSRSSSFVRSIIFDHVILMAAKRGDLCNVARWLDYKAMRMSVRGGEGREKRKRFNFLMIADHFFRIVRSCPVPANIFLSQHFSEMLLLENVRLILF
jgi:hypothetical protein